jgi:prophage maintenance system killer protein
LNGVELDYGSPEEAGDMIIKVVLGKVDEEILADWLREKRKA